MSNRSVLERLERALAAYEQDAMSRTEFVRFLTNSIEALEGVPYSVRLELRGHERRIEVEGYYEDDGFESKSETARKELMAWVQQLKEVYGQETC